MSRSRLRRVGILVVLLSAPPALPQASEEPVVTLDFQNVDVADAIVSVEKIVGRPIARESLDRRTTLTILGGPPLPLRDVIPVTSFALSLIGLTIVETPDRELKVEKLVSSGESCARAHAT